MMENAFIGKTTQPTPKQLASELGESKRLWTKLVADLKEECDITGEEWNSWSPKYGWSLRLKRKKRNIVYLGPCHGCFRVAFVLGDKGMKAARASEFPADIAKVIDEAPHYPEGSAIRFEVKNSSDLEAVKQLARIKIEN